MTRLKNKGKKQQVHPDHSRKQALECVPAKNPQIAEEADPNGELRLIYQVQVKPWFQGVLKKITGNRSTFVTRTLQLDMLGTSVWQMVDDRKSVQEIIDEFQALHQLNRREAEISVTSFFKELGRRGLLVMRDKE